jgi:hypothetical protein
VVRREQCGAAVHEPLFTLIEAARQLTQYARLYGSLERFVRNLYEANGSDPKRLAVALGSEKSRNKLPGLGVPLAAEALKNIGYDVAKPDRHVNRAAGCFSMVNFAQWRDWSLRATPPVAAADLMSVMQAVEAFSRTIGQRTAFVDNAIWLLCAKSGLWMTNSDLVALASD